MLKHEDLPEYDPIVTASTIAQACEEAVKVRVESLDRLTGKIVHEISREDEVIPSTPAKCAAYYRDRGALVKFDDEEGLHMVEMYHVRALELDALSEHDAWDRKCKSLTERLETALADRNQAIADFKVVSRIERKRSIGAMCASGIGWGLFFGFALFIYATHRIGG